MKLAGRANAVSPSITLGLNAKTLELKKQGRDIISLGVGEPDIDTPEEICRAAVEAIGRRQCRYTATGGTPALKKAIAGYVEKVYGLTYDPACVMASSGAKHVLYNAVLVSCGPGDELLLPTPYWTSYPEMARLADAVPVLVETRPEDRFKLRPEALEKAITPRTRALLLNSPSNPTGVAYTLPELQAIAQALKRHEIWVISDDIYCTLLFDGHRFACTAQLPDMRDRTILVNGVSKTFSMTGWRLGFAAAAREVIAAMTRIQDHSTSCPSAISQAAAAAALEKGPSMTADWVGTLQERRDLMLKMVRDIPGLAATTPQGAFYLWVDVRQHLRPHGPFADTMTLSESLLEKVGLAVVPGEAFGAAGFLRLSFAVTPDEIRGGIRRLAYHLQTSA